MHFAVRIAAFAGAALCAAVAHADPVYIGLSRTTPGEAYADFANAGHVRNTNSPLALKLYGGIVLTDNYAIEAGYGDFGTWNMANPTAGSSERIDISSRVLYVAGKASMPLGAGFSVFGKLGIAANRFTTDSNVVSSQASSSSLRPMLGFGSQYSITKNVAGVLEYNYYGTVGNNFRQQKLELGLKYQF